VELSRASPWEARGAGLSGDDTLEFLRNWSAVLTALERVAGAPERGQNCVPRDQVRWLPPLLCPGKLPCAGPITPTMRRRWAVNPKRRPLGNPYFFVKTTRDTLIGDGDAIMLPKSAKKIDWEVKLAVVIGRRTKYVSEAPAMECVAGYSVFNDVSARDNTRRTDAQFTHDWVSGKREATYGPMGPTIVPAKFVSAWERLRLCLLVNGAAQQDATAALMIPSIPKQIACLSNIMTLKPGDVTATGTPAGVGAGWGELLKSGDVAVTEIEGIGRLTNRCVAEEGWVLSSAAPPHLGGSMVRIPCRRRGVSFRPSKQGNGLDHEIGM
jgi:2-keto-4-pentenoate hydratase/2-oxohepta-3-ene-1,7-dioic acid hydratase in catechol pathway